MEYKQKSSEAKNCSQIAEAEMVSLMEIVNCKFNDNILRRSRQTNLVNARMVFSKILRDRGYTLTMIGKFLNKDHSTIVNYMANCFIYFSQDRQLKECYIKCLEEFMETHDSVVTVDQDDLLKEVLSLRAEMSHIKERESRIYEIEVKYSRLSEIINVIDSRTIVGQEKKIKSRVERMFNE